MESCSICLESLNDDQSYTLEACGHTFHTKCIINWFRKSPSCPCCRNLPELVNQIPSYYLLERYRELKKLSKQKNAPKDLKKLVEKEKTLQEKQKLANKNYREFREENKEVFKEEQKLRRNKWKAYSNKNKMVNRIGIYQSNELVLPNLTVINYNYNN